MENKIVGYALLAVAVAAGYALAGPAAILVSLAVAVIALHYKLGGF